MQSYHTLVAPLAMAAAAHARIPYVVTFHGGGHSSPLRNSIRGTQLRLLRPLLARAQTLVSLADFEIEHYGALLGLPRGRFVTIPNGADLPAPLGEPPPVRGRLIVSSGRWSATRAMGESCARFRMSSPRSPTPGFGSPAPGRRRPSYIASQAS